MDLQEYVDRVRHELNVAAQAGGDDAAALADRLSAPLESAIRLVVLEALSAAAEHITSELAPRSVHVRLRGRDPEFVVTAAPGEPPAASDVAERVDDDWGSIPAGDGTWRVTLRLPESLRPKVEVAARRDGISLNAWLVRAAAARTEPATQRSSSSHHVTGWVR
jgi:hypothetical protein